METATDPAPPPRRRSGPALALLGLAMVLFLATDFIGHSVDLGMQGLGHAPREESRLYRPEAPLATAAIFLHMISGAVLTALSPLQLAGALRRRWPGLHRWSGRALIAAGLVTGMAGLVYIALQGTVGGWDMSLSFGLYGGLVLAASVQALRLARMRRFERHRRWGLRLAVLGLGSWIYRMHYGLWFMATGGLWVETDAFTGAFDLVNIWAFYLPYLLALELLFHVERRRAAPGAA